MSRPKKYRRISSPPLMGGFKPFGIPRRMLDRVTLFYDEYESVRLLDYEEMNQVQAAECMNISRPTLTRIYQQARQKIATALTEGAILQIEGGHVEFEREWFRCGQCHNLIGGNKNRTICKSCDRVGDDKMTLSGYESE